MSRCLAHSGTCDQILLSVWKLLSCLCGAHSLTRSRSHVTTDGQSVSMSRYRAHSGDLWPDITFCNALASIVSICNLRVILLSKITPRYFILFTNGMYRPFNVRRESGGLLWWSDESQVKVKVKVALQLAVSQSLCQGIEPILGLVTRYYFLSEGCCRFQILYTLSVRTSQETHPHYKPTEHTYTLWEECRKLKQVVYSVTIGLQRVKRFAALAVMSGPHGENNGDRNLFAF
jgi:hypothetical protein